MMAEKTASERDRLLHQHSMVFFGRVLASTTHQINNVLSIIDQSGGLLEDLLAMAAGGKPLSTDKLARAVARIQDQSSRGLEIVQRLNKFAHSTDDETIDFDLNEVISNLVMLITRFADLKKVGFEFEPSEQPLQVTGNPFACQQLVFAVYMLFLDQSEAGESITLTTVLDGAAARVTFASARCSLDESADDREHLDLLAQSVNARMSTPDGTDQQQMDIIFGPE